MRVSLKYGGTAVDLRVPESLAARHVSFASRASAFASTLPAADALDGAVGELLAAGFEGTARNRVVGLLVADGTRERTFEGFADRLAGPLREARELRVFSCTGTHDPHSPENRALEARLREVFDGAAPRVRVSTHEARAEDLEEHGSTRRGTRLAVHPALADCEVLLVLANMKFHYFAGYSNPVKYIVPGLAAFETARGNHSLTLEPSSTFGRHPWHPDPSRRDNALAADMVEGFDRIVGERPAFALAVVGSVESPAWCGGGRVAEVAGRGMVAVDRVAGLELSPRRFLVVSPGGQPHDESLYTAQRALELTRAAVRDGGEVLFLAACPNGVGTPAARRNFFEPLTRPLDEVCRRPEGEYVMYSHKSYKFGLYLTGLGPVHMLTGLPVEEVRAIHLQPAQSAQAVLDRWARLAEPGDELLLIDDASKFAVIGAPDPAAASR